MIKPGNNHMNAKKTDNETPGDEEDAKRGKQHRSRQNLNSDEDDIYDNVESVRWFGPPNIPMSDRYRHTFMYMGKKF